MASWLPTLALLGIIALFWLERRLIGGRVTLSFSRFLEVFSLGCVGATLCALLLQRIVLLFMPVSTAAWTWGPVIEELAKASPAAILVIFFGGARWLSIADLTLLGLASGLGFEFVESNLRILGSGSASAPGPSLLFDTSQDPQLNYYFSGHGTIAACTVLGLSIGFRFFWNNPVVKWLPGIVAYSIGTFDHAMDNWKSLHTDYFFGEVQDIQPATPVAEHIYTFTLHGRIEALLVITGLLLATWYEGRLCARVIRDRREFLLPGETRPLVSAEWMLALSRAKLGRRPFFQTLAWFRLRRSWALAVADSAQFPSRAEAARQLAARLYKIRDGVVNPVPSDWVPPRKLWWPAIARVLKRYRWVLLTRLVVVLLFILPALLPNSVLHLSNTNTFALVLIAISLALTIPRVRAFRKQPKFDPVRMDPETADARYNRGFLLLASLASSIVAVLNLLMGGKLMLAAQSSFISDALNTWANAGGNPSTLLGLPGLMTTSADPPDPCADLRNAVAQGDARIQQLQNQLGGAGSFPAGDPAPMNPATPWVTPVSGLGSSGALPATTPGAPSGMGANGGPGIASDGGQGYVPSPSDPSQPFVTYTNQQAPASPLPASMPSAPSGMVASGGPGIASDGGQGYVPSPSDPSQPFVTYTNPQTPAGPLPATMPGYQPGSKPPGPRPRPDPQGAADALQAEQAAQAQRKAALANCEKNAAQAAPATTSKSTPVDINALKKALNDAMRQFEDLERQLSMLVDADLAGFQQFLQNYDALWNQAMSAIGDYAANNAGLAQDLKNLANQFQDRNLNLKVAQEADMMLAVFGPGLAEGAGLVAQEAMQGAGAAQAATESAGGLNAGVATAEAEGAGGATAAGSDAAAGTGVADDAAAESGARSGSATSAADSGSAAEDAEASTAKSDGADSAAPKGDADAGSTAESGSKTAAGDSGSAGEGAEEPAAKSGDSGTASDDAGAGSSEEGGAKGAEGDSGSSGEGAEEPGAKSGDSGTASDDAGGGSSEEGGAKGAEGDSGSSGEGAEEPGTDAAGGGGGEGGGAGEKPVGSGDDTVPGGGDNRPPDWDTQKVGQNDPGQPAEKTDPHGPDDQELKDYLNQQNAKQQAAARQAAADRVAQDHGYQNAADMQAKQQAQRAQMNELQQHWSQEPRTPRIQRIQNQTGETVNQVINRATRERSLIGGPYDPNVAEININAAQQQLQKLANGDWQSLGMKAPPTPEQVHTIFNQYQDAISTLRDGQQLGSDFWSRMPAEQSQYLQQQVNNFDPSMRQQWLDQIFGKTGPD